MSKDLRTYLKQVEALDPIEMSTVKKHISPKFEATALVQNLELAGKSPLLIFEDVEDLHGKVSHFPLLFNIAATRRKLALAFDLGKENWKKNLFDLTAKRMDNSIAPTIVSRQESPVKTVIKKDSEVDIMQFPIPTHHELDGGPYITAGCVLTKNPDTKIYNIGMYRLQVRGQNKTGISIARTHHGSINYQKYESADKPMPVAVVIGHHPCFYLGALSELPYGSSELDAIGGMLDEPLRMVPSETWGGDFLVPADAEIVVEGEVPPRIREDEGPLGEFPGYYKEVRDGQVEIWKRPVFHVKAITHRSDAFYVSNFVGHADNRVLGGLARETTIFKRVHQATPTVNAVHLPVLSGCARFMCYISLKQQAAGEAKLAALAALSSDFHMKYVVVVDDDIDVFNESEVLWAIATRTQPAEDISIIPNAEGAALDPTTDKANPLSSKIIIDATRPFQKPFSTVCRVPKEYLDKMKIETYLPDNS